MSEIQEYATVINRWIDKIEYPSRPEGLYEPIKYMLGGGGKRIRPMLLCASAECHGMALEDVRSQALGIEMFHNFTLLHDDVMDNADMRHGRPTVHRRWNIPTAILSGDTMLTLAGEYMRDCSPSIRDRIVGIFNRTAIEIYEGQQYDMNFEKRNDVTIDMYVEMIRLKTAVLLGCACAIGSILGGADDSSQENMYRYGEQLGLAFQLRDDYLDTFGNSKTFGKEIGGDILNDKKTWLRVKACEKAGDEINRIAETQTGKSKIAAMTALYKELGVDRECLTMIDNYTCNAIGYIDKVSMPENFKQFFKNIALAAISREY